MIVNDREAIAELLRTGTAEVVLATLPDPERVHSVQLRPGIAASCTARIGDWWPHRSGATVVVVCLVKRLRPGEPKPKRRREVVRLMKPRRGTTSDARQAMRNPEAVWSTTGEDPTGVPHPDLRDCEPELVDSETENRFAQQARQSDELRELGRQRRELTERLDRALESADRLGFDATRHLAAFERRIRDLEKKLKRAA